MNNGRPSVSDGSAERKKFNIPPLSLNPLSLGRYTYSMEQPMMGGWKAMSPAVPTPAKPEPPENSHDTHVESPATAKSDSSVGSHKHDAYDDLDMDDVAATVAPQDTVWPTEPRAPSVLGAPDEVFNEYYAGVNDSDSDEFDMNRFGQLRVPPHLLGMLSGDDFGATISFPWRVPGLPSSLRQTPGDQRSHHGGHEERDDASATTATKNSLEGKHLLRIRSMPPVPSSSGQNLPVSHLPHTSEQSSIKPPQDGEAEGFQSVRGTGKRSMSIQTDIMRTKSLFFFAPDSLFRLRVREIVDSQWFESVILLCILVSCVTLAAQDPTKPSDAGVNQWLNYIDLAVLWVFVFEAATKMIAHGFVTDSDSYLRSGWNIMDFLVVVISFVSDYIGVGADSPLKPIRLLRALKSLRLLNQFSDMRILVETLILSFPALGSVVIVMLFYLLFMGMIGVQFYKGLFHYECRPMLADGSLAPAVGRPWLCSTSSIAGAYHCASGEVCTYVHENRNYGSTSFDNIFTGILSIFVAITLEGWSDLAYDLVDTAGNISFLFTIANIFLGNFILMNLALAVIFESYQATKAVSQEKERRRHLERAALLAELAEQSRLEDEKRFIDEKVLDKARNIVLTRASQMQKPHLTRVQTVKKMFSKSAVAKLKSKAKTQISWLASKVGMHKRRAVRRLNAEEGIMWDDGLRIPGDEQQNEGVGAHFRWFYAQFSTPEWLIAARRRWMLAVVDHPNYTPGVMILVLVNMIALCIATADMSDAQGARIDMVSTVCSVLFSLEVLFHISARGPTQYFEDFLNVFDFVIATLALSEMFLLAIGVYSSSNAIFSVLRAVRMLRFIKMAKSWRSLQRFLMASAKAAQASTYMVFLMLLFVFMFAVMGRDLLAGKLADGNRPIFDDMYWSALTIFQVISGENWNDVMYVSYEAIGTQAVVFLVAVYVIGNMLLMNLFIAILIDTFVQQTEEVAARDEDLRAASQLSGEESPAKARAPSTVVGNWISDKWNALVVMLNYEYPPEEDKALRMLRMSNPVRRVCIAITESVSFNNFILLVIIVSTACTILGTYYRESPPLLESLNWTFVCIFAIEVLLKVLAKGFIVGQNTYMMDSWNVLDFATTLTSLISLEYPSLSWALALRSVRPLRLINRIDSFRIIISSIVVAIKESSTIGVISFIFWLLLSLFGMQLFMGALSECTDPDIRYREECVGTFLTTEGVEQERVWKASSTANFDNLGKAMQTTFEVATLEMWPVYMGFGVDARGQDEAILPDSESSPFLATYFVLVVMVFGFFIVNLFVGIVTDTFNTYKMQVETRDWTPSWMGEEWIDIEIELMKMQPDYFVSPPTNAWRNLMWRLSSSQSMEAVINVAILVVFFVSCSEHYQQPDDLTHAINLCTTVANILFTSEIIIKLTGQGVAYFYFGWNWFDFLIGMSTLAFAGSNFFSVRVLRLFRVLRVLNFMKGYRTLVRSLAVSLPGITQAAGVLVVVLMIYSITGVYLFRDVVFQEFINRHANFQDFTRAITTLTRCATGESYNGILHELMVKESDGLCSAAAGNCGTWLAAPYFFTFVMIVQMILLNMFIAVTLASYTDVSMSEHRLISRADLNMFNDCWKKVDPSATGWVHVSLLADLLHDLPEPYGLKPQARKTTVRQFVKRRSMAHLLQMLKKLRLNMVDGMIDYRQVLFRVMSFAYLMLQTIPPTDEEHAWLLGRVNFCLYLREQKKRRERASDAQLQKMAEESKRAMAGKLSGAQSITDESGTDRKDDFNVHEIFSFMESGANDRAGKMLEMLKTYVSTSRSYMEMWTYHWRRLLPRLEKLLSTPLTSKSRREHAKMACKRSNFFVGPNPRGSDRLRAVEFYYALRIVGFHMKSRHQQKDITELEADNSPFEREKKEFEMQAMKHFMVSTQSHRDLRNKFAHAPTRRAEYFNQLEQKKSILRELEHDNMYNDAPQSPAVRTDGGSEPVATPTKPRAATSDSGTAM